MSYKTILLHVDQSRHLPARIEIAARIAAAEEAHLIGAAMTGVQRFIHDAAYIDPAEPALAPYLEILRQRGEAALSTFERIAQQAGVSSLEKRLVDDEAAGGISLQARTCDLIVLGQEDPDQRSPAVMSGFPEYVVMNGAGPTLIIPYAGRFSRLGERVLIAWNGGAEATRAVRGALPLLKRARIVEVAVFNPKSLHDMQGEEAGADLALYLARHDIKVDVMQEMLDEDIDVGAAVLSRAADLGSDLIVMGCYGHSRFREILLGGATRTILQSMTVPVLMAH